MRSFAHAQVPTRTPAQVQSHAEKFVAAQARLNAAQNDERGRRVGTAGISVDSGPHGYPFPFAVYGRPGEEACVAFYDLLYPRHLRQRRGLQCEQNTDGSSSSSELSGIISLDSDCDDCDDDDDDGGGSSGVDLAVRVAETAAFSTLTGEPGGQRYYGSASLTAAIGPAVSTAPVGGDAAGLGVRDPYARTMLNALGSVAPPASAASGARERLVEQSTTLERAHTASDEKAGSAFPRGGLVNGVTAAAAAFWSAAGADWEAQVQACRDAAVMQNPAAYMEVLRAPRAPQPLWMHPKAVAAVAAAHNLASASVSSSSGLSVSGGQHSVDPDRSRVSSSASAGNVQSAQAGGTVDGDAEGGSSTRPPSKRPRVEG